MTVGLFSLRPLFASAVFVLCVCLLPQLAQAQQKVVPETREDVVLSYAPLVKRVAPAVVNVYTKRVVQSRSAFRNDPFFEFFFDRRRRGMPRQRLERSLGSGVIVQSDGIIVTNNHVIAGGEEFKVVLSDRREFDAEVILADERTDLAVLRIDTKGETMPSLEFGDSDLAEVGDLVLAIGNPFGVGQTVTSGIISAVSRTQVGISDYQFFIQTDAAINPGNSGGALVSMTGELMGVNTAIFTRGGGSIGIGFAIPANMVRNVVETANSGESLVRPWLGIKGQTVSAEIAESLGLERPVGVLISTIHPDSPAARAGLDVGDVVTAVDGFEIFDPQSLNYRVGTKGAGSKVELTYLRKGRTRTKSLSLTTPPADPPADETLLEGNHPFSGATVANLSPAFAEKMGFDWEAEGVIVVSVAGRSAARRVGFKPGDIVVGVNSEEIGTVDELRNVVAEKRGRWDLSIRRGNRNLSLSIRG